jgi:hypothetical protein
MVAMPGGLKNAIDWVSRFRPQPFSGKHGLLMSASPSMVGGNRGLWALRVPLEHLDTRIYPDMFSLAQEHRGLDGDGRLADDALEQRFRDVAYRVITGNLVPDHATIARFIFRHERALGELFADVLKLCDRAGLVKPGVVSLDATRIAGNASPEVNYGFEQIAREIVAEVRAIDEAEDEEFGEARGDELPEQLRTPAGRREFFRRSREQMRRERKSPEPVAEPETEATGEVELELDANEIVGAGGRGAMRGCARASASSSSTLGESGSDLSLAR